LCSNEPLEALAPAICDEIMERTTELSSSGQITIIIVEQQIERALEFTDRALVIERGRQA
jgi:branched-chain amino acid transport system ATP-binding protein